VFFQRPCRSAGGGRVAGFLGRWPTLPLRGPPCRTQIPPMCIKKNHFGGRDIRTTTTTQSDARNFLFSLEI
jgi:hypothetical protein